METGNVTGARNSFEKGLKLAPRSISLNENRGLLEFRAGDYGTAKKYLARAVELGSSNPGTRFSLAASRLRTGEAAKGRTELSSLESALGERSEYWEERGRAELDVDAPAAEAAFEKALQLAPGSSVAANGAAAAAERQGLDEKALSILIRARSANPDDVPTLKHFGEVCIRRDLGLDAREALERARRLDPGDNGALFLLARAHVSLQNWQEADTLLRNFIARVPQFAPAHYALGWVNLRLNRTEEARKELHRCLELNPTLIDARCDLAQLEIDAGELEAGERELREVLAKRPDHAKANVAMGDILMRKGQPAEAKTCFEKAVAADPKLSAAHYKLAAVLARLRQPEQAARERTIATQLAEEERKTSKTQLKLVLPDFDKSGR